MLFSNAANFALLRGMLGDRYTVVTSVDELDRTDPTGPFDVCIVDTESLTQYWQQLNGLRQHFAPFLLPNLVLADRRDPGLLSTKLWDVADDVVLRPVDRLELALRVQSLARLRSLSVKLGMLSDRYEHERRIAQRLQSAALPQTIDIPGIVFSGAYYPGSDDATVGGDWYDALRLPDGRVVFTIGDVTGSGLEAAVTMTNVKQAMRGIAYLHSDPALILDAADRALHATEPSRIVTAFVAVYDPVSAELRYSGAGHPRPFVRRCSGALEQLEASGTPLGIPWRLAHETMKCLLLDGDMLFLYTDGLVESERDVLGGERKLAEVLSDPSLATEHDVAQTVYARMISVTGLDDVAAAAVRVVDRTSFIYRWCLHSDDQHAVRSAKAELMAIAGASLTSLAATGVADVILAELIGNVVRHAPGAFELVVDMGAAEPVIHILDRGAGFHHTPRLPQDMTTENGRGIYIVSALSPGFTIERRLGGGSHARAILPLDADLAEHLSASFINIDAPI